MVRFFLFARSRIFHKFQENLSFGHEKKTHLYLYKQLQMHLQKTNSKKTFSEYKQRERNENLFVYDSNVSRNARSLLFIAQGEKLEGKKRMSF